MNAVNTFETIDQAVEAVLREYQEGYTYLAGRAPNGHRFKVRMNKDHDMKSYNNDSTEHILSLVYRNKGCGSVSSCFYTNQEGCYVQQKVQQYRLSDEERVVNEYELEEVQEIVTEFLEMVFEQEN